MTIKIRPTILADRDALIYVESLSTPGLSYVGSVFDLFLNDPNGGFLTGEIDGQVVACGKFTVLPDHTAWLETLRVLPEYQGMGLGKRFYDRFFQLAAEKGVQTMRMYTGLGNVVSKGLAERYGFRLEETFAEARMPTRQEWAEIHSNPIKPVTDIARAESLIMPLADGWNGFLVMNRTFYRITKNLCADFAQRGYIFEDASTGSMIVLGARFQPELALHLVLFSGDWQVCLDFAKQLCVTRHATRLNWMFPATITPLRSIAIDGGFQLEKSECIVMRADTNFR